VDVWVGWGVGVGLGVDGEGFEAEVECLLNTIISLA
jgi:hypothetical protein